ncbi:MAG: transporter substrate-binding domain-containing protein [Sneathiella sp.]
MWVLLFGARIATSQELTFSQIDGSPAQARGAMVLKELYQRLDMQIEFKNLPGHRALRMSNAGDTDGEIFRIWEVGFTHPNLIRVPTPLLTLHGYAFMLTPPTIDNLQGLNDIPRIGIQRGIIWAENAVRGRKGVVRVTTAAELADKLAKGAIDVALATEDAIVEDFSKKNTNVTLHHSKALTSIKVYHYLHNKHEGLLEKVDREIMEMTKTKELEKIANFPFHNVN